MMSGFPEPWHTSLPQPQRTMKGVWRLIRPRQWIKNGFVLAAIIFSRHFTLPGLWILTLETFGGFCLLSSAVYVMNDWHDLETDRAHPAKRHRPLAAGDVSIPVARYLLVFLSVVGIGFLHAAGWSVFWVGVSFFGLNAAYTWTLKHHFLLDAFGIASGFLLRTWAGALAIHVPMSPWLFLLVLLLTVFLALGKRRGEIQMLGTDRGDHKKVLTLYTTPLLDQFLTILVGSIVTVYAIYGYFSPEGRHRLMFTVPFIIYGLFRYLFLLGRPNLSDNPDELLVSDLPTLLNLGAWLVSVVVILYMGHRGL